jgi:uncharacterized protein YbjT (DUF2867 family)
MNVVVAGAHGQIGLQLLPLLVADGHRVRGLIRKREYVADLEAAGTEPVMCDLEAEDDYARFVEGADVAIFAAGAGQKSTIERKSTVDLGAAVKLVDAAVRTGVERFVMVSSLGAHDVTSLGEKRIRYLRAKAGADVALMQSDLAYTIVRPGFLNDGPPTGRVELTTVLGQWLSIEPGVRREIPRADVADVVRECVNHDGVAGLVFEAYSGDTPVSDAVAELRGARTLS